MEGIISHPPAGLQFPQQLQGVPVMGFPHSMQLCGGSVINPYSAAAGSADLLHPLGSFPASLQAQQQQQQQQCEPTQFLKLLNEDSPRQQQQQHAHSDDASDDVAAAPAAVAAPLPLPARLLCTNTGYASHTSSSTGVQDRAARESDGHQSAPPAEQTAAVAAAAATPASSDNKDGSSPPAAADDTAAAAAAAAGQTAVTVPDAVAAVNTVAAVKGLRVDLASPVGPKVLQGTLLSPGANIEELEGCCQALMMLGAMQQQQQQECQAGKAAAQHTKAHSKHPQHQQLQRVAGRAARSSSSGGRGAAAAAAGDRDSAGSVHTATADGRQRRGSEQGQAAHAAQQLAAIAAGADSEAASAGSQGLGRGKRQRKPQHWGEQMLMLDQIVARELGSSAAAAEGAEGTTPEEYAAAAAVAALSEDGGGSGAASDAELHGPRRKRRQQSNLAVAGVPAAAEGDDAAAAEQQQHCAAGGSSRRARGSFEGEEWAAEDDVSYDAAADLAGADSADYEIEEAEMDIDDEEYDAAAAKRGGSRGNGGSGGNSRLRRAAALQRAHGSSRKSRRANAPMYESEVAVPANAGSASFLGVSKKRSGKWQAAVRFGHDGAYAFWCCYGCPRVAARARDAAALALRGPGSARLNFPEESYTGDEIMAAAATILAKHPQLALDHPLVMGMRPAEVAAAAEAGGNELAAVLGCDADEAAGEQEDSEAAAAADRASPAAAPAPKHQRNTRSRRSKRGAAAAVAAAAAESPTASAEPQQQGVDAAAVLSRCFDLAALVLFGVGAVTEAPVDSFTEEELTAAAAAMSCRLPAGTDGRQQLLAALGGAAGMLQGGEAAAAAAAADVGQGDAAAVQQVKEEGGVSEMQQ
uniref:AP2/ERF domain-containing protein n=1 Tax=Tetradesmus obliquus TaxID=3088 RepID=A0A383VIU0_TETOB|eukprot:jgi/Sobl393_1/2367/SZX64749.1